MLSKNVFGRNSEQNLRPNENINLKENFPFDRINMRYSSVLFIPLIANCSFKFKKRTTWVENSSSTQR